MYRVLRLDDPSLTDQHWQEYYHLLEQLYEKYLSPIAKDGWQANRDRIVSSFRLQTGHNKLVVLDGERMIGWIGLRITDMGTPHRQGLFTADALVEPLPPEFAQACAPELARILQSADCDHALMIGTTTRSDDIGRSLNGERLGNVEKFRLYREHANYDTMNRWLTEIPGRNPELELVFFQFTPEEHEVRYAELLGQFVSDMPTTTDRKTSHSFTVEEGRSQAAWRRANDVHMYTYALLDKKRLIAFSNARINGSDPVHVWQLMTGVDRPYRGRGLSKWLKAAMFRKVGEDFPENVSFYTQMREVNLPIQHVNKEMGYVLESRGGEYNITLGGLQRVK